MHFIICSCGKGKLKISCDCLLPVGVFFSSLRRLKFIGQLSANSPDFASGFVRCKSAAFKQNDEKAIRSKRAFYAKN